MRPLLIANGSFPKHPAQPPAQHYEPGDRVVFLKTLQEGAIVNILRLNDGTARYAVVRFDSGEKLLAALRELRPCAEAIS